jgi:hypothetical protein
MIEKIKYWMWWRGIDMRDVLYTIFCLGCLGSFAVFGLCALLS